MPVRIALIDDDTRIHTIVKDLLTGQTDIALVSEGFCGEDALTICEVAQPDIVLMDVVMPGMDGAQATRQLQASFPDVKVLALSSYREYEQITAMLNSGATSYLVKDAMVDDLIDTIRVTADGNTVLSPTITQVLLYPPSPDGNFNLTDREVEIVSLMGRGLNNRQIASDLSISTSTVSFHLRNILDKMGLQSRSEVLVVAAKHGLI